MASASIQSLGTYALAAISAFLVASLIWELGFSPLRKFPGPLIAKFTNAWRARAVLLGNADGHHRAWHRKYGSAVRVGPNAVMLNDHTLIKTIYSTRSSWPKTDYTRPNDVMANGDRIQNLFNAQDDVWYDKYKRPVGGFYALSKVLEMEHLIDESIEKFIAKLESEFLNGAHVSETIMMDKWLAYFSWDSNMNITYGRHYGFIEQGRDVDDLIKTSKEGLRYFGTLSQMPWLDNWLDKNPVWRIGPRILEGALVFSHRVTVEYQQELAKLDTDSEPSAAGHLLERYVKAKSTHPDVVDDNQVVNYTLLSIGGGGDTTAASLRAVVYYLAKNPASYAKLRDELGPAQLATPVSWAAATQLAYLDAVVRESMRLTPGIALMLERYVPSEGFHLPDGRYVPAGTKIGINPAVTNRDTNVFGPDTDSFIPERWLCRHDETEDQFNARAKVMHEVLDFTFGAGKRLCIGRNIARLEVVKLMATLYTLFDVKLVDINHKWDYENYFFVYQSNMPMVIRRRQRAES